MPYYENMVHRSREKSTTGKRSALDQLLLGKSAPILDEEVVLTEEEIIAIKKRLKLNDGKREVRKIFDAKEWLLRQWQRDTVALRKSKVALVERNQ
ncbi:unnamed protein product [Alternaria alternata]